MITIPLQLPDQLARQVIPLQDRLPEIIELGLRQWRIEAEDQADAGQSVDRQVVLTALETTGIVTVPKSTVKPSRIRHTPIYAGGPPASEMIIAERRSDYETS